MKKLVTIILALAMILTLGVSVFAEENTNLTITNSDGRTYSGYQLLGLTTSLKTDEHHPENCDGDHTSDCYNYAYTVNPTYRAILQAETHANGRNELWVPNGKPTSADSVTDAQILDYLSYQSSDNGDVYMTMRLVADRIYRAILAADIDADAENLTGNNNEIEQGYWLFADITELTGNAANSLVMVDTKGQDEITIKPKTALPVVEKKVKDIEDSEDDSIIDNPWHDTADHDIGDTVPFKLTGTLPSNAQHYESFKIAFHDTLGAGLTLKEGSIKVYMYETKHKADVDTDMNDFVQNTDVLAAEFDIITTGLADGCTFEVVCDNVFAIEGVTKDTVFVVYYEAILNETATFGAEGNSNTAYMQFSNNPYNATSIGQTESDTVKVFTYKLVVNKTDSHNHALKGAGFTLLKKNVHGEYVAIGTEIKGADITTFTWTGLDDGDYKLSETTVPEGYNKMADIAFSISAEHSENAEGFVLISLDAGLLGEGDIQTGTITKAIVNNTGTILPETGAEGTMLLIGGGSVLVVLAAVFMITRKKMSVYEA